MLKGGVECAAVLTAFKQPTFATPDNVGLTVKVGSSSPYVPDACLMRA
jgi:hypothetical protein